MKIELKKIKYIEEMSEETSCFNAELFVDGKNVGYVNNRGCGGPTEYRPHYNEENTKANRSIIEKAEIYCTSLPEIDYETFKIKSTLENVIDKLFEDWLKEKENKKMEKQFLTKIIVGVPDGIRYTSYDLKKPLETFPKAKLQQFIDGSVKPTLKEGEVILNTNFEKLGLKK